MRRIPTVILFAIILMISMLTPAFAAGGIEIIHQPQNMVFPENASAYWTVEATGENLVYDWFIVYKGVAYNTITSFDDNHPWLEGVVGDGYGRNDVGNGFFINGIGSALDGAEIYCVVSNGTGSVTSKSAYISVGGKKSPPQLTVPASVTIERDKVLKLHCDAKAADGDSIKSYTWYETASGEMKDIIAIGAKEGYTEENSILVCDTTQPGTRYYVCYVETELGGRAYSSVIPVTVTEKTASPDTSSDTTPTAPPDSSDAPKTGDSTPGASDIVNISDKPGESSGENTDQATLSMPTIALIAAGTAAVIVGGIIGIVIAHSKKKQ